MLVNCDTCIPNIPIFVPLTNHLFAHQNENHRENDMDMGNQFGIIVPFALFISVWASPEDGVYRSLHP